MFDEIKNFQERSSEKTDPTPTTPKQLFRKLVLATHPDRGGNHEDILAVYEAYEKFQKGQPDFLMRLCEKYIPEEKKETLSVAKSIEQKDEPDEFEREYKIRKEIYDIIFFELDELFKVAKKRRDASIIKNHELQTRYRKLCAERGVSFSSDFRGLQYDQREIFDDLYHRSRSMVNEIKAMKRKQS